MTFKYSLADETEPATRRSSGRVFQAKETAGAKALGQDHVGRTVWKPVWLEQSRGGGGDRAGHAGPLGLWQETVYTKHSRKLLKA